MSSKPVVAIVGPNGLLGKPVIDAFTSEKFSKNFELPIRVVSRKASGEATNLIKHYQAADVESYKKAFEGADVVISLLGGPSDEILEAVIAAKPGLYIPSQFGTDLTKPMYLPLLDGKVKHSEAARKAGLKVVDVYTGLFSAKGSFLHEIVGHVGADPKTGKVTYISDPEAKFNYTTLEDAGNTLAVLASMKPSSIPDTVRVYSGLTTQKAVVKVYEETHGVIFEPSIISLEEGVAKLHEDFKKNDPNMFFLFLQVIAAAGDGKGLVFLTDNDREFVNPHESLFKWGKF
ncbi:hypothetical protein HG535_0A04090 [Zygotorulaspora mrakii]|uniref:NmrA-like domain-containing protein n=1 Tax=Zygotorulaspora mrakii TaxID=42260 RepID=A0A7H9AXF3_ZYGMR|nr:uncharacterized protein HG535_0A04090 [Zygotorulaspora mrakii]QLG70469.1 hypothetical protein HG535_0A04090 [Zygotorulaspora mrakii]